jgi:hypothetical protein
MIAVTIAAVSGSELMSREALEIAERGVPRSEVVERDPDPQLFEVIERANARLGAEHGAALRDLELEESRGQLGLFEYLLDAADEIRLLQLGHRQIHGE